MKKEVRIFIKNATPWLSAICPGCCKIVYTDQKFCTNCGQELSFIDYRKVLHGGGSSIHKLPRDWTEYIVDDTLNKNAFIQRLEQLEQDCHVNSKDSTILKIMRNAYIETCFGK